jgi:hypothetical protein
LAKKFLLITFCYYIAIKALNKSKNYYNQSETIITAPGKQYNQSETIITAPGKQFFSKNYLLCQLQRLQKFIDEKKGINNSYMLNQKQIFKVV